MYMLCGATLFTGILFYMSVKETLNFKKRCEDSKDD